MAGSLQDSFLAECKRQSMTVTVYLTNGGEVRGLVKGYDPFTLLLEYENNVHLIYKHAICTLSPAGPLSIGNDAPS